MRNPACSAGTPVAPRFTATVAPERPDRFGKSETRMHGPLRAPPINPVIEASRQRVDAFQHRAFRQPGARNRLGQASRCHGPRIIGPVTPLSKSIGCKSLFLKSPPALILASTSAYRRELLGRLRVPLLAVPGGRRDPPAGRAGPGNLVVRLARSKAAAVPSAIPRPGSSAPIRSPYWPTHRSRTILGKPGTAARCIEQLRAAPAANLGLLTAVAVVRHQEAALRVRRHHPCRFRQLDEPPSSAMCPRIAAGLRGGFKSEGTGITLCESIDSEGPHRADRAALDSSLRRVARRGFELRKRPLSALVLSRDRAPTSCAPAVRTSWARRSLARPLGVHCSWVRYFSAHHSSVHHSSVRHSWVRHSWVRRSWVRYFSARHSWVRRF
jgi:septum formation protein